MTQPKTLQLRHCRGVSCVSDHYHDYYYCSFKASKLCVHTDEICRLQYEYFSFKLFKITT